MLGPVAAKAIADAADGIFGTVVGRADQIDLAELRVDLQQQIVAIGLHDLRFQRQQQLLRRDLVGGEGQPARAFQVADDRHLAIIGSGGRARHARRVETATDQLQVTVMVNGLLTIPAIGFFMSAPAA